MRCLFIFFSFLLYIPILAQDCKVSAGTKTLYRPQQTGYSKLPLGYGPVFINHVGRHGARHLTKDLNTTVAYTLLVKADSLHALTGEGIKLLKMVLLLQQIEAPALKSISQQGKNELQAIAERMVKNNETVFKQHPLRINVAITKEVRTAQSADAFLAGLHNEAASGIQKQIDDTALRFYDLSPAYLDFEEKGKWKNDLLTIQSKQASRNSVLQEFTDKFFKDAFVIPASEKAGFSKDIYGFASIIPSINTEIKAFGKGLADLDFSSLFSCQQLSELSILDEAEDFLLKGPGRDAMGIQVKIAVPLLIQFINTTDKFLKDGSGPVRLRFAHAETIAPFAALMQVVSASKAVSKMEHLSQFWRADEIVPLSANIQWIFYKKRDSNDYLVKFLLNEKEVSLKGLSTISYPFYRWNDVRKFYINLLQRLHVSLTDQMDAYLLNLK